MRPCTAECRSIELCSAGACPLQGDGRGTRPRATVNIATSNKVEQCSSIIMLNAVGVNK